MLCLETQAGENFHFLEFSPRCLDCWQTLPKFPPIWFSANFTQCLATFDAFCKIAAVNESWMGVRSSFSARAALFLRNIYNLNFQRYLTHCADIFYHYHIKSHFRIDVAIGHSWTCIFTHTRTNLMSKNAFSTLGFPWYLSS